MFRSAVDSCSCQRRKTSVLYETRDINARMNINRYKRRFTACLFLSSPFKLPLTLTFTLSLPSERPKKPQPVRFFTFAPFVDHFPTISLNEVSFLPFLFHISVFRSLSPFSFYNDIEGMNHTLPCKPLSLICYYLQR